MRIALLCARSIYTFVQWRGLISEDACAKKGHWVKASKRTLIKEVFPTEKLFMTFEGNRN